MKHGVAAAFAMLLLPTAVAAQDGHHTPVGIQWFSTLRSGLDEAKRTGKPILFISAAPHCAGVSGIW